MHCWTLLLIICLSHVVANRTPLGELTVNQNMASITMTTTVDTNNEKGKAIASEQDFSNMHDELFREAKVDAGFTNDAALPKWSFIHVNNAHLVHMLSNF